MMDDVDDMFTKMTTDDEAYKILFVNLKVYRDDKFEFMKSDLKSQIYWWAFQSNNELRKMNIVCPNRSSIDAKPFISESRLVQIVYNVVGYTQVESKIAKENNNWDPDLLKVPFYRYKTLTYERRRLWLTAHFLLRRHSHVDIFYKPGKFSGFLDEQPKWWLESHMKKHLLEWLSALDVCVYLLFFFYSCRCARRIRSSPRSACRCSRVSGNSVFPSSQR